jgi:hypothetical protein
MLMIMSFLLRVSLPDRPGALGLVATALGTVGADIVSVDVIERGTGYAVDDMVVELPPGRLPDTLVSAAATVAGVRVETIRPYAAAFDPNRELELIDALVADRTDALPRLAEGVTRIFRAGWTLVIGEPHEVDDVLYAKVLAGCSAAPEVDRVIAPWWPIKTASVIDIPEGTDCPGWDGSNTELAAAPLGDGAILVGRPAMRWLPGELARLNHLAGILASVL